MNERRTNTTLAGRNGGGEEVREAIDISKEGNTSKDLQLRQRCAGHVQNQSSQNMK